MLELSTDLFLYHKDSNSFSAETSELNIPIMREDEIVLVNPKTQGKLRFKQVYDEDGWDGEMWKFEAIDSDRNGKYPSITLFND